MTPVNSERAVSDVSELVERLLSLVCDEGGAIVCHEAASALEQQARRIAALEAAVRQWASECAECGGIGIQRRVDFEGTPITDDPCGVCADIRAALPRRTRGDAGMTAKSDTPLRMSAYYYGFDETGSQEIDLILSAVACAGKAFHHTEFWGDECEWEPHEGTNAVSWIQNAAIKAAATVLALRAANAALRGFVRHDEACTKYWHPDYTRCSCGLSAALKEAEGE